MASVSRLQRPPSSKMSTNGCTPDLPDTGGLSEVDVPVVRLTGSGDKFHTLSKNPQDP